jgi:3-deoxy-D-manno-octulosonic-acid transferase
MLKALVWFEGGYTLALRLYYGLVQVAAWFGHRRASDLIHGRRQTQQYLLQPSSNQGYIWFHASSAGELEQALPLMQAWRERYPDYPILLSLYSPSAYRAGYCPPEADLCLMMVADLPQLVHQWIRVLRPRLAIFIKYDYWYHHFRALHHHAIPLYIACAKLQPYSWWLKSFARPLWSAMTSCVTEFWTQDRATLDLLACNGIHHAAICGDTRYDRVLKVAEQPFRDHILDAFCRPDTSPDGQSVEVHERAQISIARPVMIGGSTWAADHRLLCDGLVRQHHHTSASLPFERWKLILVPHEVTSLHIQSLESLLQQISSRSSSPLRWQFYSHIQPQGAALADDLAALDMLIIDQKGLLSRLYRYGQAAWIGGGFGAGIHNALEAAVYGLPIGFGPRYHDFTEAEELLEYGFATTYTSATSHSPPSALSNMFGKKNRESKPDFYKKSGGITADIKAQIIAFCEARSGATQRCLERITTND